MNVLKGKLPAFQSRIARKTEALWGNRIVTEFYPTSKSVLRPKNVSSCLVTAVSCYFVQKTGLLSVMCRVQCCIDVPFGLIFCCQSGS